MKSIFYTLLFFSLFSTLSYSAEIIITDTSLEAGTTYNWTKNNVYILDGYVYLESGGILNIEAGTVIKGKATPTNADQASALIITRGAKINATGTAEEPIIFTGELDDLSSNTELLPSDNQLWGGLIILGNAPIGEDADVVEGYPTDVIEGIPSTEPRIKYGGTEPNDNSGVLKYVSIRHGGSVLGADNEINGLTLGGVGAGTTIDYIEVFANKDDGIEFFGGTVNVTHAVVAFCGDDSYDFDESYNGYLQFILSLQYDQVADLGDHAIEYDGSEATDKTPKTVGRIYNGTFIGAGTGATNTSSNGLRLRNDGAAQFWNCIWTESTDYMFRIQDSSVDRLVSGESAFANNLVYDYGSLVQADTAIAEALISAALVASNTLLDVDPKLGGVSRSADGGLDPRLDAGSPALTGAALPTEAGVVRTSFLGAFDNKFNWALGWSALDSYGYFGDLATPEQIEIVTIKDADIEAGQSLTLFGEKEYILDGYVYVEDGATINIQPGTVVRGKTTPSTGDLASALIIARGGKIIAEGTAENPIIFTSELDDLSTTTDLTATDNQTWGGLILLGKAPIGENIDPMEGYPTDVIEGIPSTETRIKYGGTDSLDNSGILKYVSIRHGGSVLGADNEINGLTLGGVGAGTVIDYIEVFANKDDGIEFFGGTVNVTHAVVAFCGDDSYDFDESYDGNLQFIFSLQSDAVADLGDHAIEYDGSEAADKSPKTIGRIYNGTFIGAGAGSTNTSSNGLRLRNDGAAQFWNCIWTEATDYMFRIEDSSLDRLAFGESAFANNIIAGYGSYVQDDDAWVIAALGMSSDTISVETLDLAGVSRIPDGGLDPRPNPGSPAIGGAATPVDSWPTVVDYIGAFSSTEENWALGWTAVDQYGYFGNLLTNTVEVGEHSSGVKLSLPAPHPAVYGEANFSFELPESSNVSIQVYDLSARLVDHLEMGRQNKGQSQFVLDTNRYQTGMYVLALTTELGIVVQKFSVINRGK